MSEAPCVVVDEPRHSLPRMLWLLIVLAAIAGVATATLSISESVDRTSTRERQAAESRALIEGISQTNECIVRLVTVASSDERLTESRIRELCPAIQPGDLDGAVPGREPP